MKILNIVTQKGGTGKSETVKNIAYGLAEKGMKTLVVDLDPQANTTSTLLKLNKRSDKEFLDIMKEMYDFETNFHNKISGLEGIKVIHQCMKKNTDNCDVSDVLLQPTIIEQAIRKTAYNNLDILPASIKLIETDMKLKTSCMKSDTRLDIALQIVANKYDVCVIDNSPVINAITINGVTSCKNESDLVIIPIKIDDASLEGVDVTLQQMIEILSYSSFLAFDFKLLFTMRNRTRIEKDVEETLRHMFPGRCFETSIRYQAKPIVKASLNKKVLLESERNLSAKSGVFFDYSNLVNEIYESIGK